ncbi:MAG: SDR family NAD(P)-dependent oxidoreductase, partial [Chloroflexi bacterium]|nr:SDR family NAD(P)-dependent oxidoreductase [Chloroflexota bacterium]
MTEQNPFPPQQNRSGSEEEMTPKPRYEDDRHRGSGKLSGKVALVTGADSGIGRAVAVAFAREGADVAIGYLEQHEDAAKTKAEVEEEGSRAITVAGDVGDSGFCAQLVDRTLREFGRLDILVNNAAEQHPCDGGLTEVTDQQLERTFRTNIFSMFYLTRAALPHLQRQEGANVINTASVTAYKGNPTLLDYSSTKGAIVAFTRSLSQGLASKNIRVNGVAPGPIWTPLIPSTMKPETVEQFGKDVPLGRAGQP